MQIANAMIFAKTYDGESMVDIPRDVSEAFTEAFNPVMKQLPKDEHGFIQGRFDIQIIWHAE